MVYSQLEYYLLENLVNRKAPGSAVTEAMILSIPFSHAHPSLLSSLEGSPPSKESIPRSVHLSSSSGSGEKEFYLPKNQTSSPFIVYPPPSSLSPLPLVASTGLPSPPKIFDVSTENDNTKEIEAILSSSWLPSHSPTSSSSISLETPSPRPCEAAKEYLVSSSTLSSLSKATALAKKPPKATSAGKIKILSSFPEKKSIQEEKSTKRCVKAALLPFQPSQAWIRFHQEASTLVTSSTHFEWINSLESLQTLEKNYFKRVSHDKEFLSSEEAESFTSLEMKEKWPRFATFSCFYKDGLSSIRWNKKNLLRRFSSSLYSQRFPDAMGYLLSLAFVTSDSTLIFHHFIIDLTLSIYTNSLFIEHGWKFLYNLLTADGLILKSDGPLISFNLQETLRPLIQAFPTLATSLHDVLDPCIMEWLLQAQNGDLCMDIDSLSLTYLDISPEDIAPWKNLCDGFIQEDESPFWKSLFHDSQIAAEIVLSQRNSIEETQLTEVLIFQEIPMAALLALLDVTGISFDHSVLKEHTKCIHDELLRLEQEAQSMVGQKFSLSSPMQVSKILFEHLHLPLPSIISSRKLKTSHISTNDDVLQALIGHHPVIELLQTHRRLSKLYNTYVEQLKPVDISLSEEENFECMKRTNLSVLQPRIFTRWRQTMTVTGRLSSSNPNLQNIPHSQSFDRIGLINCRDAFITSFPHSHILLSVDFCQIEMRILAHFCTDGKLRNAFKHSKGGFHEESDFDIYREMAAIYSKLGNPSFVSEELRQKAKITCLALIYGSGIQTLANQMNSDSVEATKFRSEFLSFFPEISQLIKNVVEAARFSSFVTTIQGRRRYLEDLHSIDTAKRSEAERFAVNTKIQGSASDLMKVSMLRVQTELHSTTWSGSPPAILLTLHDEMLLECHQNDIPRVAHLLRECMTTNHPLEVPLSIKLRKGYRWGSLEPFNPLKTNASTRASEMSKFNLVDSELEAYLEQNILD
ncbi:Dna polymerase I domain-containing protein [Cardiosporidium cionae]|uniref:DNA-directed DNA polymerase n=1 Tax=Cardiosporidium cionae TaxID=476202 RepID=A0ABQ7JCS3_9APIC|nr:Dna polymerase I domain-containing protein [Cardiosporidium cionae]|eukprot:KAF8821425.1 Dna polymerase I domain-containing protein [Cardiosporidium cionae]